MYDVISLKYCSYEGRVTMFIIFRTQQWNWRNLHFHKGMEILLTLSDGGKMYINNAVYPIRRGSLFVMNNMDFHRSDGASDEQPYQFYAINFDADEVSGVSTAGFDLTSCFWITETSITVTSSEKISWRGC